MSLRWFMPGLFIGLTLVPGIVSAQLTVTSVQPATCRPGATTTLTIQGKGLGPALRGICSVPEATVRLESSEAETAVLAVTLPEQTSLGPFGLWLSSPAATAAPLVLLADDLPVVSDTSSNHRVETAQALEPLSAVDGRSDGPQSDFYRVRVEAGQALSCEVLTQAIGSPMDPMVRLWGADGELLRTEDDSAVGPDCRFRHRFEEAGEAVLEVRDNAFGAGDRYHLRIGDFPIVPHAMPLAIQRGVATAVRFLGEDVAEAEPQTVELPTDGYGEHAVVATRRPSGQARAWAPLYVSDAPQVSEPMPTAKPGDGPDEAGPLAFPVGFSGLLATPGEHDQIRLQGVPKARVQIRARTRSLGCATLLRMRLFNAEDAVVAETKVTESDEWSFAYTFPDAGHYRLEVSDLLERGGPGFGYHVEVLPANQFSLALKPDAKTPESFEVEAGQGAGAIELQVDRWGYEGAIQLSLAGAAEGLRLLNPVIAAQAKTHRLFLASTDAWTPDALALVGLRGESIAEPIRRTELSSLAVHRLKRPHVPFPAGWNDGRVVVNGNPPRAAAWGLQPAEPLQFAKSQGTHTATLSLKRSNEAFKGNLEILPEGLPEGWTVATKMEKDQYQLTFTGTAGPAAPPTALQLLSYGELNGRGKLLPVSLPVEWIDPVQVQVTFDAPLVPGQSVAGSVAVTRRGGDPQPLTLQWESLPAGLSTPGKLEIPADQNEVPVTFTLAPDARLADGSTLNYQLQSQYRGQPVQTRGQTAALEVREPPQAIEIYPPEVVLQTGRERQQIVVTGVAANGALRDWTSEVQLTAKDPEIASLEGTAVFPHADGETEIVVQVGTLQQTIPVRVSGMETGRRVDFESEVLVALSKQGCNSGACHGSPSGKGMFRLSLRAFDRQLDELTLIREAGGRRVNRMEPAESLLLLKPLMKVSHGGGKQLREDDEAYAILRDWITEGAQADPPETPRCVRLEVYPAAKRVLQKKDGGQQLAVTAHFADGSRRDVTHLAAYETSNTAVATIDEHGQITPHDRGEAAILVRFLEHIESVPVMFVKDVPGFAWKAPPENNEIDRLVNAKLRQLQYLPAETCSDAEFLRRAYLDVIGLLPTVTESEAFLADPAEDKRSRLIDQLLEREEYAKFWALKWGDLLKMTGKLVGDQGVYKYHRWVEAAFRDNMPYDQFAQQLLTASGSTLANPPANFYRTATDMNECVETISQVFLGARLQCAKCHNHPFEHWTQDNYYGLGAFFHRVQRRNTQRPGEMFIWTNHQGEVTQPRTGETMDPWLPLAGSRTLENEVDRRQAFAQWLVDPENPYFAKIEANRIWSQLFARGIVDPIDDFRASNPATNAPLLDALAEAFIDSGFDRKALLRMILNSRTYQASYQADSFNQDDEWYFSHQQPRLLTAEQLLDAVNQTTGVAQKLGNLPAGTKATQLPAPDLVKVEFLKVFGQPERSTVCACERSDDSNLGMAIELFNGATIHSKLRDPQNRFRQALAAGRSSEEVLRELYLAALCRPPSEIEQQTALQHLATRDDPAAAFEDICWALLNTDEFLFQH